MKTEWDYTELAKAYLKRPDYSPTAISKLIEKTKAKAGDPICDVGAGVAHLTLPLAEQGFKVVAVEPNDAMRTLGIERTKSFKNVSWFEGTGESTKQPTGSMSLVTFGSSFNVTDRELALKESSRILRPGGWLACMWNHRDLNDPVQFGIEEIVKSHLPDYNYGSRREDQTKVINDSGLFKECETLEGTVTHTQSKADCIEAWRSHATLARQAGEKFHAIVDEIETFLNSKGEEIQIPYTTRIWVAQRLS